MKRTLLFLSFICAALVVASCDLRSESAKKGMEKFASSPTPPILALPSPTPIDPADIVKVDTTLEGDSIPVTGQNQKKTVSCTKYNRVLINGDAGEIKINGACRQVMVNGDRSEITVEAATEFVLNGSENTIKYSKYVNGKEPSVVENRPGNIVEKAVAVTSGDRTRKITK